MFWKRCRDDGDYWIEDMEYGRGRGCRPPWGDRDRCPKCRGAKGCFMAEFKVGPVTPWGCWNAYRGEIKGCFGYGDKRIPCERPPYCRISRDCDCDKRWEPVYDGDYDLDDGYADPEPDYDMEFDQDFEPGDGDGPDRGYRRTIAKRKAFRR